MEKDIKLLEQNIVNHITTGAKGYKSFSAIERIRYADEVLTNTRDYCCALLGLNPEDIDTRFIFGSKINGAAGGKDGKGVISINVLSALAISNPLLLYKIAAHEMRHVYQQTLEKDNPETISYYPGGNNFSKIDWAASGSEIAADKFGFGTILRLATKGIIKSGDRVSLANVADLAVKAADNSLEHFGSSLIYKATSPFRKTYTRSLVDNSSEGTYENKGSSKIRTFTLKELENLAREKPEIYAKPLNNGFYTEKHLYGTRKEVAEDINSYALYRETHLKVRTVPSGVTLRRNENPPALRYKLVGARFAEENQEENSSQPPIIDKQPENETQPAPSVPGFQPGCVVGMFIPPEMAQNLTTINAVVQEERQPETTTVFNTVIENILLTRQGATEVDASEVSFDESKKINLPVEEPFEENFASADFGLKDDGIFPEQ